MTANHAIFSKAYSVDATQLQSDYKHVHHAEILKFLERARLDFLIAIDCPNEDFIRRGLFLVISRIDVQYKREVLAGSVEVRCSSVTLEGKKVIILQELINPNGKLAVLARVESQFLSRAVGRAVLPPEDFVSALLKKTEG
jgi:YbgC/YbaW family acyl-CoA thioester hydrolase